MTALWHHAHSPWRYPHVLRVVREKGSTVAWAWLVLRDVLLAALGSPEPLRYSSGVVRGRLHLWWLTAILDGWTLWRAARLSWRLWRRRARRDGSGL